MRILVAAMGTLGDVVPGLNIALELQNRGHAIGLATEPAFADEVRTEGLTWHRIGNLEREAQSRYLRQAMQRTSPGRRAFQYARQALHPQCPYITKDLLRLLSDYDALIINAILAFIPTVVRIKQPVVVWEAGPFRHDNVHIWKSLEHVSFVLCYSKTFLNDEKLPPHVHMGGPILRRSVSHENVSFSQQVDQFTSEKPNAIFVSLGTAFERSLPEKLIQIAELIGSSGRPSVIHGNRTERLTENCLMIGNPEGELVDHRILVEKCDATVHQCGAGISHIVLSAKKPSIVCPQWADQFDWAASLTNLGLSAGSLNLSADIETQATEISSAIRCLDDRILDQNLHALDSNDDFKGLDRTCTSIEQVLRA